MIRVPTTLSYRPPRGSKKYIWFILFLFLLTITVSLTIYFVSRGRKYIVVRKDYNNNIIQIPDEYPLSSNIKIKDTKYFRIGTIQDLDTKYIEDILLEIGNCLKKEDMRNKLIAKKPIFLIGEKIRDFREFDYIKDDQKTDDGRYIIIESTPFASSYRNIGFFSYDHAHCQEKGLGTSNIILHEALHFIEGICLDSNDHSELKRLYNKYNVENDNYNVKSYQFSNIFEFFACFADFFMNNNSNKYIAKNMNSYNNKQMIKEYMPELYTFYENLFGNTDNLVKTICKTNCLFNICPQSY